MRLLLWLVFNLGLVSCVGSVAHKNDPPALRNNLKILQLHDLNLSSGALAIASNGNFVVAGTAGPKQVKVQISPDGERWETAQTLAAPLDFVIPMGMINFRGALYLTVLSKIYPDDSQDHSDVYKSVDNGRTWHLVLRSTHYAVMWSTHVVEGRKIAVALWAAPQTGYRNSVVDFGWYDTETDTLRVTSRMATVGDEPGSFPSEVFLYRRPSDHHIVASVRWGESPDIPYSRIKVSGDEGQSWGDTDVVWPGRAGKASLCITNDGQYWVSGYHEVSRADVYTAIWRIDPESGRILETNYPLGPGGYGLKGNGQIACGRDSLAVVAGNVTLQFLLLSLK